ncbi:MAG: hypothetical protein Kow0090_10220 [Myxococcota bacterium]
MDILKGICFFAVIAVVFSFGFPLFGEEEKPAESDAAAKSEAEPPLGIQIKEVKNDDGIEGIATRFFVKGSVEDVWRWIRDVEHLGKLFPSVKRVTKVKEEDASTTIWEYELESTLGTKVLNVRRTVNDGNFSIKWTRVEGDFKYYGGSWQLKASEKYPGWVECRYSNFIDAGALIPYFIVKKTSKGNAEAMAPALRKLVSGSQN